MPRVSDNDHLSPHAYGVRQDVSHACPQCGLPPRISCDLCRGTGLVTTEQLAHWQRRIMAGGR